MQRFGTKLRRSLIRSAVVGCGFVAASLLGNDAIAGTSVLAPQTSFAPTTARLAADMTLPMRAPGQSVNAWLTLKNSDPVVVMRLPAWLQATQRADALFVSGRVPPDTASRTFQVSTSYGSFAITQPVAMMIGRCVESGIAQPEFELHFNDSIDEELCGSGGIGPITWTYYPDKAWYTIPAGLSLSVPVGQPVQRPSFGEAKAKTEQLELAPRNDLSIKHSDPSPDLRLNDDAKLAVDLDVNRNTDDDPKARIATEAVNPNVTAVQQGHPSNYSLPVRRHRLHGTVAGGAFTAGGLIRIEDAHGNSAERRLNVRVWPHFAGADAPNQNSHNSWRLAQTIVATKRNGLVARLPEPKGGDGRRYEWQGWLPPGLHIGADATGWMIYGTVPSSVTSQRYPLYFQIRSPDHRVSAALHMELDVIGERMTSLSVLSQNTVLRPTSPGGSVTGGAGAAAGAIGAYAGCGPLVLICAGAGVAVGVLAAEKGYDAVVKNTVDDNIERAGLLVDTIRDKRTRRSPDPSNAAYDIVGLQEVFDEDREQELDTALSSDYDVRWGPSSSGANTSSGLGTLAHTSKWVVLNHDAVEWVVNCEFLSLGESPCFDALANKGFTFTELALRGANGEASDAHVYVVNLHTDANGSDTTVRSNQFMQLADYLNGMVLEDYPILILGDFNVPGDKDRVRSAQQDIAEGPRDEYNMLYHLLSWHQMPFCDMYRLKYPMPKQPGHTHQFYANPTCNSGYLGSSYVPSHSGAHRVEYEGRTSNARRNPYLSQWFPNDGKGPKRLDYLLVHQGTRYKLLLDDIVMVDDVIETQHYFDEGWDTLTTARMNRTGTATASNGIACLADDADVDGSEFGTDASHSPLPCSYLSDHYGLRGDFVLVRD